MFIDKKTVLSMLDPNSPSYEAYKILLAELSDDSIFSLVIGEQANAVYVPKVGEEFKDIKIRLMFDKLTRSEMESNIQSELLADSMEDSLNDEYRGYLKHSRSKYVTPALIILGSIILTLIIKVITIIMKGGV